jgi:hypothetical protein
MQSCELVELAALATAHGPVLLASGGRLSNSALEQYWASSKCRLDRWARALRQFFSATHRPQPDAAVAWNSLRGELEEILTGEILTRVWGAVLSNYDRVHGVCEAEPVARSVMLGHLEARHRTLALLVSGQGIATEAAVAMNRLRHRAERWTDLLLAHLMPDCRVSDFAFDVERVNEFALDLEARRGQPIARHAWALTMASLRSAFRDSLVQSPNADLNARIAGSVLSCFPAEMFDGVGIVRSLWLVRLTNNTNDAQGLVEDLLRPGATAGRAAIESESRRPSDFHGRFAR